MSRTKSTALFALALAAAGCGGRETTPVELDCSVDDRYEFRNIADFTGTDSGWYVYADPTPVPASEVASQAAVTLDAPGRCGDTRALRLEAHGYNFWGSGFADWGHETSKADGTGFDGISFWARTGASSERTFMLYIDDGRTLVSTRAAPVDGILVAPNCLPICSSASVDPDGDGIGTESTGDCVVTGGAADTGVSCTINPPAGAMDTDVNGDGLLGAGDTVFGTYCRIPPVQMLCDPACYYGGAQPPAVTTCVPAPDQCGNQFHKYITTTDHWQFFVIPFSELPQWPCPNRLAGGIDAADIRKFEIKLKQGTSYEIFLDNIAFYHLRPGAGG